MPSVFVHVLEEVEVKVHLPESSPIPPELCPEHGKNVFLSCLRSPAIMDGHLEKNCQVFLDAHRVAYQDLSVLTKTGHMVIDVIHRHGEHLDHGLLCQVLV